jgi:hypothetical protein
LDCIENCFARAYMDLVRNVESIRQKVSEELWHQSTDNAFY